MMNDQELHDEVVLLRSIVNGLVRSVEGGGYVVLAHGGSAIRFMEAKHEAIRRALHDPEAW